MRRPNPCLLLVEGREDQRVIPQFMEKFIRWGEHDEPEKWPAEIVAFDGVDPLLEHGVIESRLKSPGLKALGVLVDANADPVGRWNRIRACHSGDARDSGRLAAGRIGNGERGGATVRRLVDAGLLVERNVGDLFGRFYPRPSNRALAVRAGPLQGGEGKTHAPFSEAHLDKALIHAWLALQDPPGQQLHSAIMQNILTPNSPQADPFVNWFRKLYVV